jgi:hypothetical protein
VAFLSFGQIPSEKLGPKAKFFVVIRRKMLTDPPTLLDYMYLPAAFGS